MKEDPDRLVPPLAERQVIKYRFADLWRDHAPAFFVP